MATKLEELFVELNAKNEKLVKGLNESIGLIKNSGKKIRQESDKTGKSSEKSILRIPKAAEIAAGVLGGNLVLGAIQKFTRFMGESFDGVKDLSRGVAEINTLLPENARLTDEAADAFLNFSSQYNQDISSETKAFYDIVSAGVSDTADAMEVLEVANEAAVGGLTSVATAADVITSSMNSYASSGLTARDASDSLFKAVKEGKTTFGELAGAIGKVAPIASGVGLKFGELTGFIAALTKGGLSTAEAVTGVTAFITSILKPADAAKKRAKELGLEFSTTALRTKGLSVFMEELQSKVKGNEEALSDLFPNIKAIGPIMAVVKGDIKAFNKTIQETTNISNDTSKAAEVIKDSFDFKFDQAIKNVKNLGVSIGRFFLPVIELAVDGVNGLFNVFKDETPKQRVKSLRSEIEGINESLERIGTPTLFTEKNVESLQKKLSGLKVELSVLTTNEDAVGKFAADIEDIIQGRDPIEIPMMPRVEDISTGGTGEPIVVPIEVQAEAATAKMKEFTDAEKEAAEAGKELAESLIETGEKLSTRSAFLSAQREKELIDDEEFFDAKEGLIIENFEREFDQLAEANEQKLINKQDFISAESELEMQQNASLISLDAEREKRRLAITKKADQEKIADRQKFLSTAATLARTENSVLNTIGKAAAITQIAIATPPAIASSFKFGSSIGGPPLGFAFAGIAAAAQAAQAASVAGIPLATGLTEVPPGFNNDTFPARLSSKERVVNGPQNQDLTQTMAMMREFMSGAGGGGSTVVFQNATIIGDDEATKQQLGRILNDYHDENGGVVRTA